MLLKRTGHAKVEAADQQFLAFSLGEEDYGVPIGQVLEIVRITNLIPVPHARDYLVGLMELRGSVVPIVNLSHKLGLASNSGPRTSGRAILVQTAGTRVALTVDRVARVVRFSADAIDPGPPMVRGSSNRHVTGVGKLGDQFLVLLDFDGLFTPEEAAGL